MSTMVDAGTVQERIAKHLAGAFDDDQVRALSQHFRREGYVKIPNLVSRDVFEAVAEESRRITSDHARRIDIKLRETGGSDKPQTHETMEAMFE